MLSNKLLGRFVAGLQTQHWQECSVSFLGWWYLSSLWTHERIRVTFSFHFMILPKRICACLQHQFSAAYCCCSCSSKIFLSLSSGIIKRQNKTYSSTSTYVTHVYIFKWKINGRCDNICGAGGANYGFRAIYLQCLHASAWYIIGTFGRMYRIVNI